jgi:probable rRNA maturation factor
MQSACSILLDLQVATDAPALPPADDFQRWALAALQEAGFQSAAEITVRVVDADESQALNRDYRHQDKPTNVLSFPNELPDFLREQLPALPLGDLVICAPVMAQEAAQHGKREADYWAHLTVHGVLHLLGFDHIEDAEAEIMEGHEVAILRALGMADPYA